MLYLWGDIATRTIFPNSVSHYLEKMDNLIQIDGDHFNFRKKWSSILKRFAPSSQKIHPHYIPGILFCHRFPAQKTRSKTKTMVKTCLISSFLTDAKTATLSCKCHRMFKPRTTWILINLQGFVMFCQSHSSLSNLSSLSVAAMCLLICLECFEGVGKGTPAFPDWRHIHFGFSACGDLKGCFRRGQINDKLGNSKGFCSFLNLDAPWDWNIYYYVYHKFKPKVGK